MNTYLTRRAEIEFRHEASMKLTPLEFCTTTIQLQESMEKLHHLIVHIRAKYGLVPDKASLLFVKYISKYDRLVFEDFQKEYSC